MLKPCLLAFVDDPSLRSQISAVIETKGAGVYFATEGEQLSQLAKTLKPFMILVDLSELDAEWVFRHITTIVNANPSLPVLSFVDLHTSEAVQDRAKKYGCRSVLLKSELIKILPDLVEKGLSGGF